MKTTTLVGRILFSLIFIFAAFGHFKPEEVAYAVAAGVPLSNDTLSAQPTAMPSTSPIRMKVVSRLATSCSPR